MEFCDCCAVADGFYGAWGEAGGQCGAAAWDMEERDAGGGLGLGSSSAAAGFEGCVSFARRWMWTDLV